METYEIDAVVKSLKNQARIAKYTSIGLIYTLIVVISFLFYNAYKITEKDTPVGLLGGYITDILIGKNTPPQRTSKTGEEKTRDEAMKELDSAINNVASALEAFKGSVITNQIARAITSGVLTLTIIFMGLYTIKITLMFIRYYAQLSARYDTQATAFMAANGDIDKTIKLIEVLSANEIRMGSAPESIYEKALDTVTKALAVKKD
ncbi:hypothetical protein ACP6OQ_003639 [Cronobacter dublinensis]